MGTISGCWDLKVNLRQKCIYKLTLLPKGVQTKWLKPLLLKIFSICHLCQQHRWCTLRCEYLREMSKKFETALMMYSGAWGKQIHEKNQKSKISWHCPFKVGTVLYANRNRKWLVATKLERVGCVAEKGAFFLSYVHPSCCSVIVKFPQ